MFGVVLYDKENAQEKTSFHRERLFDSPTSAVRFFYVVEAKIGFLRLQNLYKCLIKFSMYT